MTWTPPRWRCTVQPQMDTNKAMDAQPKAGVAFVAQVSNLLYRRLAVGSVNLGATVCGQLIRDILIPNREQSALRFSRFASLCPSVVKNFPHCVYFLIFTCSAVAVRHTKTFFRCALFVLCGEMHLA